MRTNTEKCARRKAEFESQRKRLKAAASKRATKRWKAKIKTPLIHQWKYAQLPVIEFCPSPQFSPAWLPRLEYRQDVRHDPRFGWYVFEPNSQHICCRPNLPWRKVANEERKMARGWRTEKIARQAVLLIKHHQFNWLMPQGRAWVRHLPMVQCADFPIVLRVPDFEAVPHAGPDAWPQADPEAPLTLPTAWPVDE